MRTRNFDYYDPTLVERVEKMAATHTIEQARKKLKITHHCFNKLKRIHGITFKTNSIPDEDADLVSAMLSSGMTVREVSEKFEVSIVTTYRFMKKHHIITISTMNKDGDYENVTYRNKIDYSDAEIIGKVRRLSEFLSVKEISERTGLSRHQINRIAKENDIRLTQHNAFEDSDAPLIQQFINEGYTVEWIGNKWGVHKNYVYSFMKKHNITPPRRAFA